MTTDPMHRPSWRGRTNVDALTIQAIEAAERRAGFTFVVTQGSYQNSVAASAGTHDGGGVVDLRTRDLTAAQKRAVVLALRQVGFAAWLRLPSQGPWVEHVHAVLLGHPKLAPSAARQAAAYRDGRNGLANNAVDDGPRLTPIPVYRWKPSDDALHAALVEARKAANAAAAANRAARAAITRASAQASKVGRKKMAANLERRRQRFDDFAKRSVTMRKWLNGRAKWLRSQK